MQNNNSYIASLIERQWIRNTYVASDLFTINTLDQDFVGGYRPMILEMKTLRDIVLDDLSITDLIDTPTVLGTPGQILQMNTLGDSLQWIDMVDTFLELTDTPSSYTGFAEFQVVVNAAQNGLEFVPPITITPSYEARVSFNGAIDPVNEQLLNSTLGVSVSWTITGTGMFQANFSASVDATKITAYIGNSSSGSFVIGAYTASYIQFIHRDFAGTSSDPTSVIPVEIKLYP
jgi:hypothetical protein